MTAPIAPSDVVAFVGLGQMGLPMAKRCLAAGFAVRGAAKSSRRTCQGNSSNRVVAMAFGPA